MGRRQYRSMTELPAWGTAEAPPVEIRLWPYGEINASRMGKRYETVYLTPENAQAIEAEWTRRQIRGAFDYDHEFKLAAGWYDIEARQDGLWLVGIQWTPTAQAHFTAREYRYCSPAFYTQRDASGKDQIVELTNVALTNFPATDNQRPLIALGCKPKRRRSSMTPDEAKAKAAEIVKICAGDESKIADVALLLVGGMEEMPSEELPAAPMPVEEMSQEVVQTAMSITGLSKPREVIGALKQLSVVSLERDKAVAELAQLRHHAAVEQAIKDRKLSPARREEALKADPAEFAGAMRFASVLVDDSILTPKSNEPKEVKPEDAINDEMRGWCRSMGKDVTEFAAYWTKRYPGVTFKAR